MTKFPTDFGQRVSEANVVIIQAVLLHLTTPVSSEYYLMSV